MKRHIEDTLTPETVNELLLLNRIRDLRIAAYEKGLPSVFDEETWVPSEVSVSYPPPLNLHLAADVCSDWEKDRGISIRGRSRGRGEAQLGFSTYISRQQLEGLTQHRTAEMLDHMHRDLTRQLAGVLSVRN